MADADPRDDAAVTPPVTPGIDIEHVIELRRIRRLLFGILLLVVFTAVYFARIVLLPIMIAIMLTLTLLPVVRAAARIGIPNGVTAIVLMLTLSTGLVAGGYTLSGPVQSMIADAPRIAEAVQQRVGGLIGQIRDIAQRAERMAESVTEEASGAAAAGGDKAGAGGSPDDGSPDGDTAIVAVVQDDGSGLAGSGMATTVLSGAASTGSTLFAALLLTGFLLAAGDFYHRRIVEAAPRLRDKKKALTIVRDVERQISRYLAAITVINIALGIAVGTIMWFWAMPAPILWGVVAALLNFIPFIGCIIGVILAGAVAIITYDTLWLAMGPPLSYLLLNTIEGNVITPMLVGRRLEINTVAMLIAVAFWMWIWGIPGAILAVPFLVVVKAIADNVDSLQILSSFLSAEPGEREGETPRKATTGPALDTAPFRAQAVAREESPPTRAPGEGAPGDDPAAPDGSLRPGPAAVA
ncbi:putative permease [Rubellimicrobium thermophilum DSM 16684]|uniref:Putative permease n=1 Tax=Rubellimicrobium thermophilum DSM 16684 TaxID=1123069 RepID=S9R2Y6_9RHOB|nr:AI-2E family transporter [Rubellimicrobium thermophilum]EPX86343.1 putative permease [Rubellimicrobium thermophilum DSM 16684]